MRDDLECAYCRLGVAFILRTAKCGLDVPREQFVKFIDPIYKETSEFKNGIPTQ